MHQHQYYITIIYQMVFVISVIVMKNEKFLQICVSFQLTIIQLKIRKRFKSQMSKQKLPKNNKSIPRMISQPTIPKIQSLYEINEQMQKKSQCKKCRQLQHLIEIYKQSLQQYEKKERKLRKKTKKLQQYNIDVIQDAEMTVKDFSIIIQELQKELEQKNYIIQSLENQLEQIKTQLEEQKTTFQEKFSKLHTKLDIITQQFKDKNKVQEDEYKENLTLKNNEINQLKLSILKLVTQKSINFRKNEQLTSHFRNQQQKLTKEIQSLQSQITEKQQLIRVLSESNNQIRIQLIQLKNKTQTSSSVTSSQQKQVKIIQQNQSKNKELKKQNEQLKNITDNLQKQIKNLVSETQEIETMLVKVKLQRDLYRRTSQKLKSQFTEYKKGYGSIHRQVNGYQSNVSNMNNNKHKYCSSGNLKINKTDFIFDRNGINNQMLFDDCFDRSYQN